MLDVVENCIQIVGKYLLSFCREGVSTLHGGDLFIWRIMH